MAAYFGATPRPLSAADAQPARQLVLANLGMTPYVDRVLELLAEAERGDRDTQALAIQSDGTCAALALFGEIVPSNGVWKLHALLLGGPAEEREVGGTLLDAVLDRVRTLGARYVVAELPADAVHGGTLTLLRSHRFSQEGRIPDFYRDAVALLFLKRSV